VDLFLFPNSYIDVATVSEVPRLTGGKVHKYSYFQVVDADVFVISEISYYCCSKTAYLHL